MKLKKYKNATVAKYDNKRAMVYTENEGFIIAFKKIKETSNNEKLQSFVDVDGKLITFGFRLTKEGAIALCSALFVEIYKDVNLEEDLSDNLFKDLE